MDPEGIGFRADGRTSGGKDTFVFGCVFLNALDAESLDSATLAGQCILAVGLASWRLVASW